MTAFYDRAKMAVTTAPGTGVLALGAVVPGYQSFAAAGVADGGTFSYVIEDGNNFEYGRGTYAASGPTFTRTTIINSSAGAGEPITATANATIAATVLAEDLAALAAAGATYPSYNFIRLVLSNNAGGNAYDFVNAAFSDIDGTNQPVSNAVANNQYNAATLGVNNTNPAQSWSSSNTYAPVNFDCTFANAFVPGTLTITPNSGADNDCPQTVQVYYSADGGTTIVEGPLVNFTAWSGSTPQTASIKPPAS